MLPASGVRLSNAVLETVLAAKCVSAVIKASSETWEPHLLVFGGKPMYDVA